MEGEKVERRRRLSSSEFDEILKKKKRLSSKEFRELFDCIWQGTAFVKFQNPEVWREMPRGHEREKSQ
jgi:predicted HAD superfamily hydrolase